MGTRGRLALVAALGAALLAAAVAAPSAAPANGAQQVELAALESGVLAQLNAIRAQHGLRPLRSSPRLAAAAVQHTREMAADGYFAHESADGSAFWDRVAHFYGSSGYGYWSVGENLLWSSPSVDAGGALRLWMRSPEHRANILSPTWHEIGIAAVHSAGAPGTYRGRPVTIVTTDFGVRR